MLDNYEEIAFKAVTYPVVVSLCNLADELTAFCVKDDCEDNCMFLLDWIDRLDKITHTAHEIIEDYTAQLGYHVVNSPELETPENF